MNIRLTERGKLVDRFENWNSNFIGSLAKPKAGHDKGEIFVIIKEDSEYVYLVNGKNRTVDNPKKKKKKHIQLIKYNEDSLIHKIKTNQKIINEDIKRTIKIYNTVKEI